MSIWTTKFRGPAGGVLAFVATAAVIAGPVSAAEQKKQASKQENIGVVSGLTIGALAGGPFGAVIGAAGGAILGDRYHKQSVEKAALSSDLSKTQAARTRAEGDLAQTRSQGELMGQALDHTDQLELAVGFRTGDDTVSDEDVARLQKMGALASSLGKVKMRVSGYADPRGSQALNDALSERRADAVAHVLASTGISPSQLVIEAHGEADSKSPTGDLDGYAMERRVTVRIEQTGEGLAAAFRK